MTVGKPGKVIFAFAIPLVLSGVFQQLYSIADSVIVGNFVGADGLAAVGVSFPILMLFIAVAMGTASGCSVVISRLFGAKMLKDMKTAVSTSVILTVGLSIVLSVLGIIFLNPIMNFMNTPLDIFSISASYLKVGMIAVIFVFIYNGAMGAFLGMGDSKTPLFLLVFASIFNVVLDLIFVAVLNFGVMGAAWATFIAQGSSGILALICLRVKLSKIKTEEKNKLFDLKIAKMICKIAVPSIVQQSIVSIGQLLVQIIINSYGSDVVAGYSAAVKINSFISMPIGNMSNALSNFTAQNLGANKVERVKQGYKSTLKMTLGFCIVVIISIFMFGDNLIGIFINGDSKTNMEVINIGVEYLQTVGIFYIVLAFMMIANGVLRGAGDMKIFMCSTMSDLFIRVSASYILNIFLGVQAVWIAIPIGWSIGMIISIVRYKSNLWRKKMQLCTDDI